MFTGIIEELGRVGFAEVRPAGMRIRVDANLVTSDISDGDSIAVNGVCLTALDVTSTSFYADVSPETLQRTTLGGLGPGSRVNLERAVLPTTRFGGHIVQGHVDAKGTFLKAIAEGEFWTVSIAFPVDLGRYFIEKGSVAIEGISLTIARLHDKSFDIAVIPKTWEVTNLSTLKAGDHINLEVDMVAKYIERYMKFQVNS